jgi:hypothetical protein
VTVRLPPPRFAVEPPMRQWQEIVESGVHKFHKDFVGVTLTITKLDIPNAWACLLPDGKRVVGEMQTVRETVELVMSRRGSAKSRTT